MWFRRGIKAKTINAIIQIPPEGKDSNPQQQEGSPNATVSAKRIKIMKICIFTLWSPMAALFFILVQECQLHNIFKINRDVVIGLLGPIVISAGFAQMSHYSLYQLRDSKSLTQIRSSIYWIINETTQIVVVLLVYSSLCFALINMFLEEPNKILFSIEASLYVTSLQCLIIGFIYTNKFGVFT